MRLKADALLESVGGLPDFPVVAETLRECFDDALDVPRLRRLLERVHDRELTVRHVDTPLPSPFVYPLLMAWDWAYLDAGHAEERRSDAVVMRKAWSVAPGPLDPATIAAVEAELQHTAPERRARDANELAALLDELGDLTRDEVAERVVADADILIDALVAERRIVPLAFPSGRTAWVGTFEEPLHRATTMESHQKVVLRLMRARGPMTSAWLAERYGFQHAEADATLDALATRGVLRKGTFVADRPGPHYLHVAVLEEIQRRQLQARRMPRPVATPQQFTAFLLRRHHLQPESRLVGPPGVLSALELLQGEDFPVRTWEQELLGPRVDGYEREWLDRLGLAGEIVWTVFDRARTEERRAGRVGVVLRENVGWLRQAPDSAGGLDTPIKNVLLHLQLRGASFAQDLARGAGLDHTATLAALWELFWAGLATPDTFSAILAGGVAPSTGLTAAGRKHRRGQTRGTPTRLPTLGRWSVFGADEPLSPEERVEARARLLLARYGVVARELAAGDWSALRHALMRMEYGGEVVRGYFVEGLSGEQYALEEALAELETSPPRRSESYVLVSLVDPVVLWGRVFTLSRLDGERVSAPRVPTSWLLLRRGCPILLAEGHGRALTPLAGWETADFAGTARAFQSLMDRPAALRPVRRLEIETWQGAPVRETQADRALTAVGFATDAATLYLDGRPGVSRSTPPR
jgi:ATP-dependent Lhr-like helicase